MFSFRKAVDTTSIAQTIGRMVRTPLARRIEEDERLNSASVFLPHYNKAAVESIVEYLRASGDSAVADSLSVGGTVVALARRVGSEAAVAAIEAIPSYLVPVTRARQEVRRLIDLARALSTHGVAADAFDDERTGLAVPLETKRIALAADAAFIKAVNDEGEIIIDRVEWAVGEASIATETTLSIPASDDSFRSIFAGAKRLLGGEAAMAYWKARLAVDPATANSARLEAYALAARPEVMTALNDHASARITALFVLHAKAIEALAPARREVYRRIRGSAPEPSPAVIHLPDVIEFRRGEDTWPLHLYAQDDGNAPFSFNSWETDTLKEDLAAEGVVAWLRNVPRKEWALCIRWPDKNAWHPLYPDFLVVRAVGETHVVDILDPHDNTKPDAPKKAQGLAEYAQDHGASFGHIDLIAKVGGKLRRLHLEDEKTRQAVAAADSNDALLLLYQKA